MGRRSEQRFDESFFVTNVEPLGAYRRQYWIDFVIVIIIYIISTIEYERTACFSFWPLWIIMKEKNNFFKYC
jgi:hypothetical protein